MLFSSRVITDSRNLVPYNIKLIGRKRIKCDKDFAYAHAKRVSESKRQFKPQRDYFPMKSAMRSTAICNCSMPVA